jgi:hypothetical protein
VAIIGLSALGVTALGACGSGDDGGATAPAVTQAGSTPPEATPPPTRAPEPTSGESVPIPSAPEPTTVESFEDTGAQLVGSWTVDASETLANNLANLGGVPAGLTCGGPINITFFADGLVTRTGEVVCSVEGLSGTGSITSTAAYIADGSTLVFTQAENEFIISVAGTDIPITDAWRDGGSTYAVDGDVLSITFTDPAVGTVTTRYTRTG